MNTHYIYNFRERVYRYEVALKRSQPDQEALVPKI